jgi:hypothetical protein
MPRRDGSLKMVEIADRLDNLTSHPNFDGKFRPSTHKGLTRAAKVLRAADVLCDALKAKETDASIKFSKITADFRKAVRES